MDDLRKYVVKVKVANGDTERELVVSLLSPYANEGPDKNGWLGQGTIKLLPFESRIVDVPVQVPGPLTPRDEYTWKAELRTVGPTWTSAGVSLLQQHVHVRKTVPVCAGHICYGDQWFHAHAGDCDDVAPSDGTPVTWNGRCNFDGINSYARLSNGWTPYFHGLNSCDLSLRHSQCPAIIADTRKEFSGTQADRWSHGIYGAGGSIETATMTFGNGVWLGTAPWGTPAITATSQHPSCDARSVVRRFTASTSAGKVRVSGSFGGQDITCGNRTANRVCHNGSNATGTILILQHGQEANFSFETTVNAGDVFDFVTETNGSCYCDSTSLSATRSISRQIVTRAAGR